MSSRSVAGMLTLLRFVVSVLVRRFRSRAVLDLENLALRHQLQVLRRQRPGPTPAVRDRPVALGLALPIVGVSGGDGVGQAGNGDPVAPVRDSPCFGVGARDPGDRQWSARFVT